MNKTLWHFRHLALAEGLSLITLIFIAMPLKYYADIPAAVPIVGIIHGMLFLAYIGASLVVSHKLKWSIAFWLMVLLASIIPAAAFILDIKLKKMDQAPVSD